MNRFVIGGILAAIVVLLTGSLNRLLSDSEGGRVAARRDSTDQAVGDLGTLPIEQAGRLVQRQSQVGSNPGTRAGGDSVFGNQGEVVPPGQRSIISPDNTGAAGAGAGAGNVIPRAGGATTFPATGDVAPIQPDLVQPGATPRPTPDPDLESIPALW
ncbi:MAG TPA: hypothetical protein VLS96_21450 [Nodosilinea sp.]|nr:hypothetical protein [Nodosilinea sp.]